MRKNIIEYILNIASLHKKVKVAKYEDKSLINISGEEPSFEFIIEDSNYLRNVREGVQELELNIDVISFVNDDLDTILSVQDEALNIWEDIYQYLDNDANIELEMRSYDALSLSEFTTDKSAGIRITLAVDFPVDVNKCNYLNNFNE